MRVSKPARSKAVNQYKKRKLRKHADIEAKKYTQEHGLVIVKYNEADRVVNPTADIFLDYSNS